MIDRRIGAHVSASGGLYKAIENANNISANCLQLFSGSPRVWKRKQLSLFNVEKMFSKQKEFAIKPIFVHSLYLVNLASDKPELLEKSFNALQYDLKFNSLIKASGIIVHLGSHQGRGFMAMREQVAEQIARLLKTTPKTSTFLIENSAGQNGKLCSDLEEIRWLFNRVEEKLSDKESNLSWKVKNRLGWCFDTCHAFAAGYFLGKERTISGDNVSNIAPKGASKTSKIITKTSKTPNSVMKTPKSAIKEIGRLKLWDTLKCIHVNDSRDDFASGKDRHANLGEGNIPEEDFKYFLNYESVKNIPLLLEVPGIKKKGPDKYNIDVLKSYCE